MPHRSEPARCDNVLSDAIGVLHRSNNRASPCFSPYRAAGGRTGRRRFRRHSEVTCIKWIRSAFWVGQPKLGCAKEFDQTLENELVPALNTLPGVDSARILWPRRREDDPPAFHCQLIVEFADQAALETMLDSPERAGLRDRVREVAALFEGRLSHIDFEVGAQSREPL